MIESQSKMIIWTNMHNELKGYHKKNEQKTLGQSRRSKWLKLVAKMDGHLRGRVQTHRSGRSNDVENGRNQAYWHAILVR